MPRGSRLCCFATLQANGSSAIAAHRDGFQLMSSTFHLLHEAAGGVAEKSAHGNFQVSRGTLRDPYKQIKLTRNRPDCDRPPRPSAWNPASSKWRRNSSRQPYSNVLLEGQGSLVIGGRIQVEVEPGIITIAQTYLPIAQCLLQRASF